jgi:CspA family cold shock protein
LPLLSSCGCAARPAFVSIPAKPISAHSFAGSFAGCFAGGRLKGVGLGRNDVRPRGDAWSLDAIRNERPSNCPALAVLPHETATRFFPQPSTSKKIYFAPCYFGTMGLYEVCSRFSSPGFSALQRAFPKNTQIRIAARMVRAGNRRLCAFKERAMAQGTVKFFNPGKGFGFIVQDNGGPDVFVHISAVERAGMRTLNEGQKLKFDIEADRRSGKTAATNLQTV